VVSASGSWGLPSGSRRERRRRQEPRGRIRQRYLVNDSPFFRRWKTSAEFHEHLRAAEIVIDVDEATGNEQIV
jgi:hypothetical protein